MYRRVCLCVVSCWPKVLQFKFFIFPPNALQCERRERAHAIAEIPQNSTPHRIPRKHNAMFVSATSNDARSSGVTVCMRWSLHQPAGLSSTERARQAVFRDQTGPVCARRRPRPGGEGGAGEKFLEFNGGRSDP